MDVHFHLHAGIDDGPRTEADALEMCRIAYGDGTQMVAATAHQNEQWKLVTPKRILESTPQLPALMQREGIPLTVFPCAEVMAHPEMELSWLQGELLCVANRRKYLLVEMPHQLFVYVRHTAQQLPNMDCESS